MSGCETFLDLNMGIVWLCECANPDPNKNLNTNFPSAPFHPVQTQGKALEKKEIFVCLFLYLRMKHPEEKSHLFAAKIPSARV